VADLRRIYLRIIGSRIRSQLTYRTSFALDVIAQFLGQSTELVAILVLFTQVSALGGFSAQEVLLIYGLAATAFGLADLTVGQVEELPNFIRTGEFDVMLLRPLGTLPQLLSADIALKRLGRVASGLLVLGWSLATLDLPWTPARALLVVITPIAGAVILSAIWVAANSVSFWIVDGREMANSFTYGSNFSTAYPITIYGPWLRRALCYAVPAAFVAYFPALGLLGRPDPLGLPTALQWSSPVVAVIAVAVAGLIWRSGVRHYQGTGS
jgi:viologen exporter family transport system permease protein